jgi:hypothetical protein
MRWIANADTRQKLTTAGLLLGSAVSIWWAFLAVPDLPDLGAFHAWYGRFEIAAKSAPVLFLGACLLVFFRPRLGYGAGLLAGALALPWYILTEISLGAWNTWSFFNYESSVWVDGGLTTFATRRIVSTALIVMTVVCSLIRLLPASWFLRGKPVHERTWPAPVAGLAAIALWFAFSVTPYRVPGYDHPAQAEMRILHIQKHGLHFEETTVTTFRDWRVARWSNSRSLFQYRFEQSVARTTLVDTVPAAIERVRALVESHDLWNLRTAAPKPLRSWNAEGWYAVLKDSRLVSFTTESGTTPPREVTELFRELEQLPPEEETSFVMRDVCLGFCYDPVAALGFTILPQRQRLLAASSLVQPGY